jgi:thiamine biosynthesis lipoprotein
VTRSCGWLATILLLLPSPADAAVAHAGQPVMGTVLAVTVVADDAATARRLADAAVAEAHRWDDLLTTWRPEGELARLNARAGQGPVRVRPQLAAAVRRMQAAATATGGAFDPLVGSLVEVWRRATPPAAATEAAISAAHRGATVRVEGDVVTLPAGVALDAGGIGKGMALDAMAALLRSGGARAAFLDFGGSSQLALGTPPEEPRGWRVVLAGLREGQVLGLVWLRDASLSTSRASGPGAEAGPIVDPGSGRPVAAARLATVLAPDATSADAWSTALIVLGRDGVARAEAAGLKALVDDGSGLARSPAFPLQPWVPATAVPGRTP